MDPFDPFEHTVAVAARAALSIALIGLGVGFLIASGPLRSASMAGIGRLERASGRLFTDPTTRVWLSARFSSHRRALGVAIVVSGIVALSAALAARLPLAVWVCVVLGVTGTVLVSAVLLELLLPRGSGDARGRASDFQGPWVVPTLAGVTLIDAALLVVLELSPTSPADPYGAAADIRPVDLGLLFALAASTAVLGLSALAAGRGMLARGGPDALARDVLASHRLIGLQSVAGVLAALTTFRRASDLVSTAPGMSASSAVMGAGVAALAVIVVATSLRARRADRRPSTMRRMLSRRWPELAAAPPRPPVLVPPRE